LGSDPKWPAPRLLQTPQSKPVLSPHEPDQAPREAWVGRMSGAASNGEAYEPPASAPPAPDLLHGA